jgi:hypothetical protein
MGILGWQVLPKTFFLGWGLVLKLCPTNRPKVCPFRLLIPIPPIYGDTWLTNYNQNFFSGQIP